MWMEGLAELARTGGAGWAVALLMATAVIYLFRQLSKEREICANDWRITVAGNTVQMKEWTAALTPFVTSMNAHTRAIELMTTSMTAAINQLSNEIAQSREVLLSRTEEALQSNRGMREALLKKGVDL
jgi:hypothetical protein